MKALLREPVVHFVIVAAVLFGVDALFVRRDASVGTRRIEVTRGDVDHLRHIFQLQYRRPPMREELEGLIAGEVRERVLYREALAMGLDRDDVIVRRRLAQKLDFVSQGLLESQEPSEAQIAAYFEQHGGRYRTDVHVSFDHLYFSPERRKSAEGDARVALVSIKRSADASATAGDPFLLELEVRDEPLPEIERRFGADLARAVATLPTAAWRGPVRSSFGWHLVRVVSRVGGDMPRLEAVRDRVRKDCVDEMRRKANEEFYARLKARYEIDVAELDTEAPAAAQRSQSREAVQ
jgi:peptidyl-prolyl cis-trans isomerase C